MVWKYFTRIGFLGTIFLPFKKSSFLNPATEKGFLYVTEYLQNHAQKIQLTKQQKKRP